jgi:biopolymer transport protein TolQ
MAGELDMFRLVLSAGPVVKAVMIILLAASIFSWAAILERYKVFKLAQQKTEDFEAEFWRGGDIQTLFRATDGDSDGGMASVFSAGFREYSKTREKGGDAASVLDNSRRAMGVARNHEVERLERQLNLLATVGSTAPYIGLFGTVWGILNSFQALGGVQQASLTMVAPGIAEALIATALGLFAAIPAVIAYNHFNAEIERLDGRFNDFIEEFTNVLQRQLIR